MDIRWIVDNALNFTPHLAVLALALAAYAIFGRHWTITIAALVFVVLSVGYIARSDALLARAHDCGPVPQLRIATFNVQAGAADLEEFAQYAEREDIEIVILEEMTRSASFRADALYERYPYRAASSPRWVEILSTIPLDSVGSYRVFGESQARHVWRATITDPFAAEIYFFHGQTSRSADLHEVRSKQYDLVTALLGETSTPAIVVGDMNATVLDPTFASMLRATDLRTSVDGHHESPSWPSGSGPLGIRIDHVLERGFEVCSVDVGPSLGSDHRAVVVGLAASQSG